MYLPKASQQQLLEISKTSKKKKKNQNQIIKKEQNTKLLTKTFGHTKSLFIPEIRYSHTTIQVTAIAEY